MSFHPFSSSSPEPKRGLFNLLPSVSEEDNITENPVPLNRPTIIPLNLIDEENPVEPDPSTQQNLREVMKSNQKSLIEAQLLYEHVKKFPFFEAFNDRNRHNYLEKEAFIQLCQRMRYEKHPGKSMIFQEGDISKGKVYIIFSGSVLSVTKDGDRIPTTTVEEPAANTVHSDSDEENKSKEQNMPDSTPPNRKTVMFDLQSTFGGRNKGGYPEGSKGTPSDLDFSPQNRKNFSPNMFKSFTARDIEHKKTINLKQDGYHRPSFFAGVSSILDISDHSDPKDTSGNSLMKLPYRRKDTIDEKPDDSSPTPDDGFFNFMRMSLVTNRLKNQVSLLTRQNTIIPARTLQRQKTRRRQVWLDKATLLNLEEVPEKDMANRPSISLRQMITQYGSVKSKISSGGFFGEKALFSKQRRSETIIAKTECEFLVINKRDFRFVSDNYDYKRRRLLDFMMTYMPDFENITAMEQIDILLCALNQRTYERDSYITKEGENGDHLYILYEGSCEIIKTLKIEEPPRIKETVENIKKMIRVNPSSTQEVTLCRVDPGEFLGLEVIFGNRGVYDLSVKVSSSQAKVFVIDRSKFFSKFSYVTRYHMDQIFEMRREYHIKTMCNHVASKFSSYKISLPEKPPGKEKEKGHHDLLSQGNITLAPLSTAILNDKTRQLLLKGSYAPSSSNAVSGGSRSKSKTVSESPKFNTIQQSVTGPASLFKDSQVKEGNSPRQGDHSPTQVIKKKLDAFSRIAKGAKLKAISDEYHIGNRSSTRTMSTHIKTNSNVFSISPEKERHSSPFAAHEIPFKLPALDINTSITQTVNLSPQRSRLVIPPLPVVTNSARGLSSELGMESPRTVELSYASNQKGILSHRDLRSPLKSSERDYFHEVNTLFDFEGIVLSQRNKAKKRLNHEVVEEISASAGKPGKQYTFTRVLAKMKDRVEKKHKKANNKVTELLNFRRNNTVETLKIGPEVKDTERGLEVLVTSRTRLDSSDMILQKEEVMSPTGKERKEVLSYDLGVIRRSQSEEKKDPVVMKKPVSKLIANVTLDLSRKSSTIVKAVKNEYYGMTKLGADYGS